MVSTYANESLIRGNLEMLLRQKGADRLEVIVIDSGSPQDERSVVESLQSGRDNIVYVRTSRETLYAAWNRALEMSTGTYFANVNVDDWIRDDALEVFAGAMDRHSDCDLAYANWAMTDVPQGQPADRDPVSYHPPYEPALPLFYCYGGSTQFSATFVIGEPRWFRRLVDGMWRPRGALSSYPGEGQVVARTAVAGGLLPEPTRAYRAAPMFRHENKPTSSPSARTQTPLDCLYDVDLDDAGSMAAGWTALGNMAVQTRVPWQSGPLNDVESALGFYGLALAASPGYPEALHNRYALLLVAGRVDEAEHSLDHLTPADAARIRGVGTALVHPRIEPAVRGPVFEPDLV